MVYNSLCSKVYFMTNLDLLSRSSRICYNYESESAPISSFSKFKFSPSFSESEFSFPFSLEFLFIFIALVAANAKNVSSSLPLTESFSVPGNLMRTPPQLVGNQVAFINLDCTCMTVYEFILFPGPFRVQVGLKLVLILYLVLASSSKCLAAWYDLFHPKKPFDRLFLIGV